MKAVVWIRHGQSTGNAGMPTRGTSFPLSSLGVEQARALSRKIPFAPDLIAASPFRRAWETAAPTAARYPGVPMEIWPETHEFVYLPPASEGEEARWRRAEAYWARMDPFFRDGEGAESFADVMARAASALERLRARGETRILVFSHEQFIKCVQLSLRFPSRGLAEQMAAFRALPMIRNCEMLPMDV